jgi:hypothetical protein|tara:strand:+ start:1848 stop:2057 length:210 start_codon:yes stop_codon:yes gene_type:complete
MANSPTTIQNWIDNYTFNSNSQTSNDILVNIVREITDHGFTYGPTVNGGYSLTITGSAINQTFVVKADG